MANADYQILRDDSFTLNPDQDREFNFDLPNGVVLAGNQRPILTFLVKPNVAVGQMRFRVDVNDNPQVNESMGGDEKGGFWEAVNNNVARVGPNTIQFRVLSGFGNVTFSDVVLWYQRT